MKRYFLYTLLLFMTTTLFAQYRINLSRVDYPTLNYLKLGNAGPKGEEIKVNNLYMTEGGKPVLPVMQETKKYNYFMNDFVSSLAPAVAYLTMENWNCDNLQWTILTDGTSGYLFCSKYLYRHGRKDYEEVWFDVKLKNETFSLPRRKITVRNGVYFLWPFNQCLNGVTLKYATAQTICSLRE